MLEALRLVWPKAAPPSQATGRVRTMIDRYTVDIVKNAMLTMWNDICADTDCHPLDIEHGRGKYLTFTPKHWAEACGKMVRRNVLDLIGAEDGKKSEGGIQGAPEIPGVRGPRTFVRQLVDDPNSSSGKSLRDVEVHPSDPTPPDREAIAQLFAEALDCAKECIPTACACRQHADRAILALRGGE